MCVCVCPMSICAQVLDIEVQSALLAAEETCQFDLCPPDYRDLPARAPAPPLTQ